MARNRLRPLSADPRDGVAGGSTRALGPRAGKGWRYGNRCKGDGPGNPGTFLEARYAAPALWKYGTFGRQAPPAPPRFVPCGKPGKPSMLRAFFFCWYCATPSGPFRSTHFIKVSRSPSYSMRGTA